MAKDYNSMIGEKFYYWEVLGKDGYYNNKMYLICKCKCGYVGRVAEYKLKKGLSKSCGCRKKTRDGLTKTRQYSIWNLMKYRCYDEKSNSYHNYGDRGIQMCDEWIVGDFEGFKNFYNWSLESGYSDELTIDRIDVNGNYEPDNCRWADWKTQCRNRRDNVYVTLNGETKTIEDWAEELNIPASTLSNRNLRRKEDIFDISNKIDTTKYTYISKIKNREKYRVKIKDKYIGVADTYEEAEIMRDKYIAEMSEDELIYARSRKAN